MFIEREGERECKSKLQKDTYHPEGEVLSGTLRGGPHFMEKEGGPAG